VPYIPKPQATLQQKPFPATLVMAITIYVCFK